MFIVIVFLVCIACFSAGVIVERFSNGAMAKRYLDLVGRRDDKCLTVCLEAVEAEVRRRRHRDSCGRVMTSIACWDCHTNSKESDAEMNRAIAALESGDGSLDLSEPWHRQYEYLGGF